MDITKKQYQIFKRINKKLKTIPDFFIQKSKYFIRKYKYLLQPHYIISSFHLKKNNRGYFIVYNDLKIFGKKRQKQEIVKFTRKDFLRSTNNEKLALLKAKQDKRLIESSYKISDEIIEIDDDDEDDDQASNKTNMPDQYVDKINQNKENVDIIVAQSSSTILSIDSTEHSKSNLGEITIEPTSGEHLQNDNSTIKDTDATDKLCVIDKIITLNDKSELDNNLENKNKSTISESLNGNGSEHSSSTEESSSEDNEYDENEEMVDTNKKEAEGDIGKRPVVESISLQEQEDDCNEKDVPPEEVNKQLREQLSLLQMGKRKEPLIGDISSNKPARSTSTLVTPTSSRCTSPFFRRNMSLSSIEDGAIHRTPDKTNALPAENSITRTTSSSDGKRNFIDSLINKLKRNSSADMTNNPIESTTTEENTVANKVEDIVVLPTDVSSKSPNIKSVDNAPTQILSDDECSIDSTSSNNDFFGFNEGETVFERPNIPGLLPTPIVFKSSGLQSAFISETLDNFMKENALDNAANVALPAKITHDEAMMCAEARPPTLECPQLPVHMDKPRTVAEKRLLLEKETDIKYLMIENESTVSRELRRRSRNNTAISAANLTHNFISKIQQHHIPFRRDCWRATCWLCTENGKFYYQTFRTKENTHIKIFSGRGNNERKCIYEIPELSKKNAIKNTQCKCPAVDGIRINNLEIIQPIHTIQINEVKNEDDLSKKCSTKLLTPNNKHSVLIKPAPLSQKQLATQRSSLDLELGPLEIFKMPLVEMEVWPKLDRSLPESVKPYLKMAMPFTSMTEEWVKFAVSTVKEPPIVQKKSKRRRVLKKNLPNEQKSFVFEIPYLNDQKNVLVRKRKQLLSSDMVQHPTKFNHSLDDAPLTFAKDIDRNDVVSVAVADMLNNMFNSVEIQLSEPFLIKMDPDLKYSLRKRTADIAALTIDTATDNKKKKGHSSQRVMKELRRLNATIIDACAAPKKENCTEEFCRLGCVCDSLSVPKNIIYHCKKAQCMFECQCSQKNMFVQCENRGENMQLLRDRATAFLAKEEKEFTATVMVSRDETIYIPNTEYVGKRNKKVPKRFNDCVRLLDNHLHTEKFSPNSAPYLMSPEKGSPKRIITEPTINNNISNTLQTDTSDIVNSIRHVSVSVVKLPYLDNFEPWCMVHCLYKCFCRLKDTDGIPFQFNDNKKLVANQTEEPNATVMVSNKKRQYTFVKDDDLIEPLSKVPKEKTIIPAEPEIFSSARIRRIHTISLIIRNRSKAASLRRQVHTIEHQQPELRRLLNSRIKHCLMYKDEKLYTIPDDEKWVKMSPTIQIENRTVVEKARSNTESLLRNPIIKSPISKKMAHKHRKKVEPSSTCTSKTEAAIFPLQSQSLLPLAEWNTPLLEKAPKNLQFNQRYLHNVKFLNYWVNRMMNQITSYQKNTNNVKSPVQNALNCVQWSHLVDQFQKSAIYVWQVQLNTKDVILALTVEDTMPIVQKAVCVINIKAVELSNLPVLAKLLKSGVSNDKTKQLAVLLCGVSNYWHMIGFIHSQHNYMEKGLDVRPTPLSHPLLASKINRLFDLLTNRGMPKITQQNPSTASCSSKKQSEVEMNQFQGDSTILTSVVSGANIPPLTPFNKKSNIPITTLTAKDLESIFVPIPVIGAHRWFMLTLANDFTHIFIPSWKNFLSYSKIQKALEFAKENNKTVKISTGQIGPDVYAAHNENNKIFFGPYKAEDILDLELYHKLDGRMVLLEDFNKMMWRTQTIRTSGCWLYMKDDNVMISENNFECRKKVEFKNTEITKSLLASDYDDDDGDEDDDDCIIIENNEEIETIHIPDVDESSAASMLKSPTMRSKLTTETNLKNAIINNTYITENTPIIIMNNACSISAEAFSSTIDASLPSDEHITDNTLLNEDYASILQIDTHDASPTILSNISVLTDKTTNSSSIKAKPSPVETLVSSIEQKMVNLSESFKKQISPNKYNEPAKNEKSLEKNCTSAPNNSSSNRVLQNKDTLCDLSSDKETKFTELPTEKPTIPIANSNELIINMPDVVNASFPIETIDLVNHTEPISTKSFVSDNEKSEVMIRADERLTPTFKNETNANKRSSENINKHSIEKASITNSQTVLTKVRLLPSDIRNKSENSKTASYTFTTNTSLLPATSAKCTDSSSVSKEKSTQNKELSEIPIISRIKNVSTCLAKITKSNIEKQLPLSVSTCAERINAMTSTTVTSCVVGKSSTVPLATQTESIANSNITHSIVPITSIASTLASNSTFQHIARNTLMTATTNMQTRSRKSSCDALLAVEKTVPVSTVEPLKPNDIPSISITRLPTINNETLCSHPPLPVYDDSDEKMPFTLPIRIQYPPLSVPPISTSATISNSLAKSITTPINSQRKPAKIGAKRRYTMMDFSNSNLPAKVPKCITITHCNKPKLKEPTNTEQSIGPNAIKPIRTGFREELKIPNSTTARPVMQRRLSVVPLNQLVHSSKQLAATGPSSMPMQSTEIALPPELTTMKSNLIKLSCYQSHPMFKATTPIRKATTPTTDNNMVANTTKSLVSNKTATVSAVSTIVSSYSKPTTTNATTVSSLQHLNALGIVHKLLPKTSTAICSAASNQIDSKLDKGRKDCRTIHYKAVGPIQSTESTNKALTAQTSTTKPYKPIRPTESLKSIDKLIDLTCNDPPSNIPIKNPSSSATLSNSLVRYVPTSNTLPNQASISSALCNKAPSHIGLISKVASSSASPSNATTPNVSTNNTSTSNVSTSNASANKTSSSSTLISKASSSSALSCNVLTHNISTSNASTPNVSTSNTFTSSASTSTASTSKAPISRIPTNRISPGTGSASKYLNCQASTESPASSLTAGAFKRQASQQSLLCKPSTSQSTLNQSLGSHSKKDLITHSLKNKASPSSVNVSLDTDVIHLDSDSDEEDKNKNGETSLSEMAAVTAQAVIKGVGLNSRVVCVVKGCLVSNVVALGRIEAYHRADGIKMKLLNMKGSLKVKNLESANLYLDTFIRQHVFAFQPRDLEIKWKFVPESKLDPAFVLQSLDMFTPTTVVTEDRLIDLTSDFETDNTLSKALIEKLLVLKLANMCMDKVDVRRKSIVEILKRGEEFVKSQITRETKFEKFKMFYAIKIHLNKLKLKELKKSLPPDVIKKILEPADTTSDVITINDDDDDEDDDDDYTI